MTTPQTYLSDANYQMLVDALLRVATRYQDPASAVMEALGEIGGVWPVSVKDDPHFE